MSELRGFSVFSQWLRGMENVTLKAKATAVFSQDTLLATWTSDKATWDQTFSIQR